MNVDKCVSGKSQGFFGVELYDSTRPDHRVRAVQDPVRGPLLFIRTTPSGGPGEQIPPEQCRLLDLEVRFTGKRVNDIRGLEGSLEMDCDPIRGRLCSAAATDRKSRPLLRACTTGRSAP